MLTGGSMADIRARVTVGGVTGPCRRGLAWPRGAPRRAADEARDRQPHLHRRRRGAARRRRRAHRRGRHGAVAARRSSPCCRSTAGSRTPATSGGSGPAWPASGSGCSAWSTAAAGATRAGREPARPDPGQPGLRRTRRRPASSGVEHVVGQRLTARASWPAGPRSARRSRGRSDTTRPSSLALPLAQTPNISDERAGDPEQEAAAAAASRAPTGRAASPGRRRRRTSAGRRGRGPRARGCGPGRGRGRAATCADLGLVVGVERVVAEGVRRHQPRVVVLDRQQVAGRQVAGLDPLLVGHPVRRHDRLVAGDQHDLVDGDRLLPRGPGHGDRPAPADGSRPAGAGEQVGDDPLALGLVAEVVADVGGARPRSTRKRRAPRRRPPRAAASGLVRAAVITVRDRVPCRPVLSGRGRIRSARGSVAWVGRTGQDGRMTHQPPEDRADGGQRWRDPHDSPGAGDRAAHRRRRRPASGPRRWPRRPGGGPRDRPRRPCDVPRRPAGLARRGRRRVGAVPADRAARVQRRRRRRGGDLAGRHAVLPGPDRRGPRPGGAVPRPDDAAVRDRGAADRAVPRPVQPRPALGDRRDDGDPGVPLLGAGRRGRSTSRPCCSRPRSACWSRPRRTASRRPPPYPGWCPTGSRW